MTYARHLGKLIETFEGRDVSPVLASIARKHVPVECHGDFIQFLSTGCSTEQMKMIVRYMGGTEPAITFIEIEERKGTLLATMQLPGGINYMGDSMIVPGVFPETIRLALVGRPLSDLIDHPLLPGDVIITGVQNTGIPRFISVSFLDIEQQEITAAP